MFLASCHALVLALGAHTSLGEREFPYMAYVAHDNAAVRSGPGNEFYATDRLAWGTKVEVYRHHGADWCAIRPPAGSFSWVAADHVRVADGTSIGEIATDDAVTRVGTRFSPQREVAYIRLKRGELVEVIDAHDLSESQAHLWCKISPPSGEFRWVRLNDLHDDPSQQIAEQQEVSVSSVSDDEETFGAWTDSPIHVGDEAGTELLSASPELYSVVQTAGFSTPPASEAAANEKNPEDGDLEWQTVDEVAGTTRLVNPDLAIERMQLELSYMVSRPTGTWDLESLQRRAEELQHGANLTGSQRSAIAHMLSSISRFQSLQNRYRKIVIEGFSPMLTASAPSLNPIPAENDAPFREKSMAADGEIATGNPGTPYDGRGWLMPVLTQRRDMPRYAITDDQGNIQSFISAGQGLKLQRYLRRQVGVFGQTRQVPNLHRPHITVDRVVALDRVYDNVKR